MKNDEYKLITTGRGGQLRDLMRASIRDSRDIPGRSELTAQLQEILPEEDLAPVRAALLKKFEEFARAGQEDFSRRFDLRGTIDRLVLHTETELARADSFVRAEPVVEDVDVDAAVRASDPYSRRIGGELDRAHDEERAAAQELVRKAGLA